MDKKELDGASKDSKNKTFPVQFQFEILWHYIDGEVWCGVYVMHIGVLCM